MIVRPRRRLLGSLEVIPSRPRDGFYLVCEAVTPASAEGRKVTVWVPPEDTDDVLRALRAYAIERRR